MKGRKRTELEQSTRESEKTNAKSATLYSPPPLIVTVSSQKKMSRTEDTTPTKSKM